MRVLVLSLDSSSIASVALARDGEVLRALPGQTVYCPAGEEHWHGADPEHFMEHLAMLENAEDPSTTTTWLEHVSDEDYARRP